MKNIEMRTEPYNQAHRRTAVTPALSPVGRKSVVRRTDSTALVIFLEATVFALTGFIGFVYGSAYGMAEHAKLIHDHSWITRMGFL